MNGKVILCPTCGKKYPKNVEGFKRARRCIKSHDNGSKQGMKELDQLLRGWEQEHGRE